MKRTLTKYRWFALAAAGLLLVMGGAVQAGFIDLGGDATANCLLCSGTVKTTTTKAVLATATPTPTPLQQYTASLNPVLNQWFTALEARRGSHFLQQPVPEDFTTPGRLSPLLGQWFNALEGWRGAHFLQTPTTQDFTDPGRLDALLTQWHGALESWWGIHFLTVVP